MPQTFRNNIVIARSVIVHNWCKVSQSSFLLEICGKHFLYEEFYFKLNFNYKRRIDNF